MQDLNLDTSMMFRLQVVAETRQGRQGRRKIITPEVEAGRMAELVWAEMRMQAAAGGATATLQAARWEEKCGALVCCSTRPDESYIILVWDDACTRPCLATCRPCTQLRLIQTYVAMNKAADAAACMRAQAAASTRPTRTVSQDFFTWENSCPRFNHVAGLKDWHVHVLLTYL